MVDKKYICESCKYKWESKKKFGEPSICPKCKKETIIKYKNSEEFQREINSEKDYFEEKVKLFLKKINDNEEEPVTLNFEYLGIFIDIISEDEIFLYLAENLGGKIPTKIKELLILNGFKKSKKVLLNKFEFNFKFNENSENEITIVFNCSGRTDITISIIKKILKLIKLELNI